MSWQPLCFQKNKKNMYNIGTISKYRKLPQNKLRIDKIITN